MLRNLAKLSVFFCMLINFSTARADSSFFTVNATACENISSPDNRSETRFKAYDKATFAAVRSNAYVQEKNKELDDHRYDAIVYRLTDTALSDVSVITTVENSKKICIEISGKLNKAEVDNVIAGNKHTSIDTKDVATIAKEINETLPKSLYETDSALPLVYIKDTIYYNGKTTSAYTSTLTDLLLLEPKILVTDNEELADYYLIPKLLLSKADKINEENYRYSMSVKVEIQDKNNQMIDQTEQNRYIIINKNQDRQEIAQKLYIKLLKDSIKDLSKTLNGLM